MKRCYLIFSLVAGSIFGSANLHAHGGVYVGPGDVVPPSGNPPPTSAPPTGPKAPSPASPGTGGGAGSQPATPVAPAPPPGAPVPGSKVESGGNAIGVDLSTWVFWWEFNKDRFLKLKSKIRQGATITDRAGPLAGLGSGAAAINTLGPTRLQIQNIIVPSLFELIEKEDNQDIATATMIALAKIGIQPKDCRRLFESHLDAPVQEVKETAVLAYGIMQDEGAIPLLENLIKDTKAGQSLVGSTEVGPRTRAFAIYSLALIGGNSIHEEVKQKTANLLYEALLQDRSAGKDFRVACVIGIGTLNLAEPTDTVQKLSALLHAQKMDTLVLAHIPNAMAKLLLNLPAGDFTRDATIDQFIKILKGRKYKNYVRQSAIQSLGMLAIAGDSRNKEIFTLLRREQKNGKGQQAKHFTAISMAYLGAADPLMQEDVTKFLMTKMKKSSTAYEPWCGLALGVMAFMLHENGQTLNPIAMQATLEKFEDEKSPEPKGAYAIALGLMDYQPAKSSVLLSLEDSKVSSFRGYAAISLGLLQAREHLSYLAEVVADSKRDPHLLMQASIGLGLMKDRGAVSNLLIYLQPENGKKPRIAVLASVASALGFIGDKSSVAPLVETMNNKRVMDLGRAFSAVALGMVADKELMPWNARFSGDLNYRAAVFTLTNQATGILDIR